MNQNARWNSEICKAYFISLCLAHIDSALFNTQITQLAMLDIANNGNPLITKRDVQLVITDM
jgi:hypothetical protein